ncbi:hypothetical protein [Idiomarina abyssalis]|uniref:Uncharacterized protein n=1 Tax=Idiomarina abyssalis TaxID=86102 RepID=A0A8I1KH88_9GAMM|nr:hypothetical protein [Idiomarina abyssalis]MBJ7268053.1 hypothetical protein [Idiomarina abyssalis]MBJ7272564.1 hypothetical protein [Idiomarina abyssalis]MBJ7316518.1 hypothetical protein [Idiomarina abyssalis]
MNSDQIANIENQIDLEFSDSLLNSISYSQSLWTVLSVMEDKYLKMTQIIPLEFEYQHAQIDILMNALTHPIRCIYKSNDQASGSIVHDVIDNHYGWAHDWIEKAVQYSNFHAIFPLYWKGKISIKIDGNNICADDWRSEEPRYEVYNRLVRKDGDKSEPILDPSKVAEFLIGHFRVEKNRFQLNLTPRLVKTLVSLYADYTKSNYKIPDDWKCCYFGFGEFKKVYTTIQAILFGRFIGRSMLAMNGLQGLGYSDAVWVLPKSELENRLSRYSGVEKAKIRKIIEYLTFGNEGIRNPDVAIQPIVDLKNGALALSPFIFLHSNAERNLCVLLNQIPEEKVIYARLTQKKEDVLKNEIIEEIKNLGYRVESGKLNDTDLDIAVIDDENKLCVVFELKWFIEPAEIRESLDRSEELEKGIEQGKKLLVSF